jgi:hypothetical protein
MTNWGCRGDPAEENISCTLFVTLRVWVQKRWEGRAAQLLGSRGSRGVGVNQTFESRMANRRESTPRLCSQAGRGFVPKPQRRQKSCVSLLYLQPTPFPWLALEKSRMISTDRQLQPFPWPGCLCWMGSGVDLALWLCCDCCGLRS